MPFRDVVNKGKWNKRKYYSIYYCIFLNIIKMLLDIIFISYDSFIYCWFWSRKNTVDKDFYKLSLCSDTKKQAWNKNQNF